MPMAKPSPSFNGAKELISLGKTIKALRIEMGLSQEAFADEIGIDRSYLGGIERGEHNVALMNLIKISSSLNIPLSKLIELSNL
jgi:transcriptional regulator with XRE-family HTH domain